MKVLFIITARGGSKGIPKKNIKILGKLPLIAYNIISAQKCNIKKRIIVSTDDPEIAEVALRYGAEVPFKRPKELATDEASSIDVVIHAMEWIEENDKEHVLQALYKMREKGIKKIFALKIQNRQIIM